jgi:hypothetical protein
MHAQQKKATASQSSPDRALNRALIDLPHAMDLSYIYVLCISRYIHMKMGGLKGFRGDEGLFGNQQ